MESAPLVVITVAIATADSAIRHVYTMSFALHYPSRAAKEQVVMGYA